jgi:GH15 family glucan-1,4-alpha-glucosidase
VVALFDLGYEPEAAAYAYWVLNATSLTVPRVRTLYGVHGEDPRDEREVPGLRGYLDSLPVRQGNQAEDQLQLDNWGQLVDAVYTLAHRSGNMDRGTWRSVRAFVEFVRENWRQPDQGIWEIRSGRRHLVHSKIMCWVALDRGARLIRGFGLPGPAEEWEREAEEIRRTVLERGVDHERGSLVRAFGDTAMDASLLEAAVVRFLPGDDPLMVRTIDRIREELGHEDLVYRYRVEDGMPGQEGAFLPCSFWLVQALALAGKKDEAEELYDRVCERANDLGLFPEEIDPDTGRFLGNFPQGLTHIALVNAAATLNRAGGGDG